MEFKSLRNIESSFRQIRLFGIVFLSLTLDVECYVADRIALLANLRERCLWGGDTRKFHTQFGVGIKFIIN